MYELCNINNVIVARGTVGPSNVIVCKRPDANYSITFEDVEQMALSVSSDILKRNK